VEQEDNRFLTNFAATQSIATSGAQNDSGMFELNFRDERYLPFEGAGVVSEWRIDMPKETNAFDLDTISDVILKINYTAREGGEVLHKAALAAATLPPPAAQRAAPEKADLPDQVNLRRMFSARHEFPSEWHRFLHPTNPDSHKLELALTQERFPFQFKGKSITVTKIELFLKLRDVSEEGLVNIGDVDLTLNNTESPIALSSDPAFNNLHHGSSEDVTNHIPATLAFTLTTIPEALVESVDGQERLKVEDLIIVCHYTVTKQN
jgi:hypothetical protein